MDYQQPSWAGGRGRVGWEVGQVTSMAVLGSVDKPKHLPEKSTEKYLNLPLTGLQ